MATEKVIRWEVRWDNKLSGRNIASRNTRADARGLMKMLKNASKIKNPRVSNIRMFRVNEIYDPIEDKYYSVTKRAR